MLCLVGSTAVHSIRDGTGTDAVWDGIKWIMSERVAAVLDIYSLLECPRSFTPITCKQPSLATNKRGKSKNFLLFYKPCQLFLSALEHNYVPYEHKPTHFFFQTSEIISIFSQLFFNQFCVYK